MWFPFCLHKNGFIEYLCGICSVISIVHKEMWCTLRSEIIGALNIRGINQSYNFLIFRVDSYFYIHIIYIFFVFAFCQVEHLHNFILFRFSMGFVDSIIAKCKYALKEIVEWDLWKNWSVINVLLLSCVRFCHCRRLPGCQSSFPRFVSSPTSQEYTFRTSRGNELVIVVRINGKFQYKNKSYFLSRNINENQYIFLFKDYYQSGRMLLRMSQALGRIVLAGREMTRLAGWVRLIMMNSCREEALKLCNISWLCPVDVKLRGN